MPYPASLPNHIVREAVAASLREDLGLAGDLTSQAVLAPDAQAKALMNVREGGVVCGFDLAEEAFRQIGPGIVFERLVAEGDKVAANTDIARISGNARLVLSAERVALNFMNHMSGIATHTARYVAETAGTSTQICDTRKTLPGLRVFAKYASRCGGGANHRFGLSDAILIKDNHIAVAGGVRKSIEAAREFAGHLVAVEIEVETLEQLAEALETGVEAILLDNMDNDMLARAVKLAGGRTRLEASGGVVLERIRSMAATGVDFISTSQITMGAPPLDIGLDISLTQ